FLSAIPKRLIVLPLTRDGFVIRHVRPSSVLRPTVKLSTRTETALLVGGRQNIDVLESIKTATPSCYSLRRERAGMETAV
ncbi:MAG: hypothetical protein VX266_06590, partial [Pseudomonadota bacterium]|nr:hypothetical protein [Pseudomonadota bacterium]